MANLAPKTAKNRSRLSRTLVLTALTVVLIVFLIAYRTRGASFRWDLFLRTVEHVNWLWLGASICLILLTNVGRALRWKVMLRPLVAGGGARSIGVWKLTSDTAIGLTAGVLLGRAGEVVRPYLIALQTGSPLSSQAAIWLLERMLDLLAVLLICGYALIQLPQYTWRAGPGIQDALVAGGYGLASAGVICLIILLAFRDRSGWAGRRILDALNFLPEQQQHRAAGILQAFSLGVESTRDRQSLALLIGYTALEWVVIVGSSFALFRAFSATQGFRLLDVLVVFTFITLGSLVQVPGIGGGAQAASILALTSVYRLPVETASAVALLLWIVSSIAIIPFGLACVFHEGLNWSKLKLLSTKQIVEQPEVPRSGSNE